VNPVKNSNSDKNKDMGQEADISNGMNRREFLKTCSVGAAAFGLAAWFRARAASGVKPNIIFMVADNLGRESVGFYKDDATEASMELAIGTPRLDAMASRGVIFDNCLVATPLCGPARCGWNTGRHAYRVGMNSQPKPDDPESGVSPEEITIAEILKAVGYDTALFGKWNQGYAEKFSAVYQGFDEFYGSNAGHADYYTHVYDRDNKRHFYRNLTPINDEGYFDQLFTDEALKYLRKRKGNPKPFYLNLTFYAPHGPYQTPPGYDHSDDRMVNYKYMIQYLDSCVGRVLDEVQRLGMAENTLIVFLSDQGASTLNDFERNLAQGGLKVVCNALWPGRIPAGKRIQSPWLHLDLYAVFAGVAGAVIPQDRVIDARDVWPLFAGQEQAHDRTFYWTFGDEDAVRIGDMKLRMKDGEVLGLFDLATDADEEYNLASARPCQVTKMRSMLAKWKAQCEAQQTNTAESGTIVKKKF